MTDTFRALCAELLDELEYQTDWSIAESLKAKARAALGEADEPAVPEGREPAAVTGQPSDEDLLELAAAEMNNSPNWEEPEYSYEAGNPFPYEAPGVAWVNFARAVLARWGKPTPVPPADGEVAELMEGLRLISDGMSAIGHDSDSWFVARAAELLKRQVLVPVPVSKRPWEREEWCDTDGLCWLGSRALDGCTPTWLFGPPAWAERFPTVHRVVLPAHALPLPEVNNG